jgi:hypothetical protein
MKHRAYWLQNKREVRFTHKCLKNNQKANPWWTMSEPKADPERTHGGPKGNAKFLKANPEQTQRSLNFMKNL